MHTESEKYKAVVRCDQSCDGHFLYGVRTTGVFCRPSCSSRPPRRENVLFFDGPEEAIMQGFRPCKRCRPDLLYYRPGEEMAARAKTICIQHFADQEALQDRLGALPVTSGHLARLFRGAYQTTPVEYVAVLRVEMAKRLLRDSDQSVLEIALDCGYRSLSSFYDNFRRITGTTASRYRKAAGAFRQNREINDSSVLL